MPLASPAFVPPLTPRAPPPASPRSCPWTGTAIGKKNMAAFQCFVGLVFACLILDIVLLTMGSVEYEVAGRTPSH